MSDFMSKLPDFKELSSMANKLFSGLKNSVNEIVDDYKQKRAEDEAKEQSQPEAAAHNAAAVEPHTPPVETPAGNPEAHKDNTQE